MPADFEVGVELDTDVSGDVVDAFYKRLMDAATAGYNWSLEQAPEDRGTLKQTSFPPEKRQDGTVAWGYTQPYAAAQEYGTGPYYPPLEPLLEWSERVTGDKGLGYYVAREKIPTEGIEGKHYARDGLERQTQWLQGKDFEQYLEAEQR